MIVKKLINPLSEYGDVLLTLNNTPITWDDRQVFTGGSWTKHFYFKNNIIQFMLDYDTLVIYNENIPLAVGYYIGNISDGVDESGFDFHIVEFYSDLPDLETVEEGETYIVLRFDNLHQSGAYEATQETWRFVGPLAPSIHNQLSGLDQDDHTHYFNITRGDERYYKKTSFIDGYTAVAGANPVRTAVATGKIGLHIMPSGISHSSLGDLANDDHTQYLRTDGARTMGASYDPSEDKDVVTVEFLNASLVSGLSEVAIRAGDTTPGYLDDKLTAGSLITKTILNPGGNEEIRLDVSSNVFDKSADKLDDISDIGSSAKKGYAIDGPPFSSVNTDKNKLISQSIAKTWNDDIAANTSGITTITQDDWVTSSRLAEADGSSGQDTSTGSGVKTNHIQDSAVTTDKIATQGVTRLKLADNSVATEKVRDDNITADKINPNVAGEGLVQADDGSLDVDLSSGLVFAAGGEVEANISSGLVFAATSEIEVLPDNDTLEFNNSGELQIKEDGIKSIHISGEIVGRSDIELDYNDADSLRAEDIAYNSGISIAGKIDETIDNQLTRSANDWSGFPEVTTLAGADLFLFERESDGAKRTVECRNMKRPILLTLTDGSNPFVSDQSATYSPVGRFIFPGTDVIGSVSSMKVISWKGTGGTDYDVRVYDYNNNQTIAEVTGFTNLEAAMAINSLGTISNLPASEAIFEIQVRSTSVPSAAAYISAFTMV